MGKVDTDSINRVAIVPQMYLGSTKSLNYGQVAERLNKVLRLIGEEIPFKIEMQYREVGTMSIEDIVFEADGRVLAIEKMMKEHNFDAFFITFKGWLRLSRIFFKELYKSPRFYTPNKGSEFVYRYDTKELKFYTELEGEDETIHLVKWNRSKEAE